MKMRCLLIQHGYEAALDPFLETMTDADKTATLKTDVYKKAHSALLLWLNNKVLREVNKEDFAACVWLKLETLYMTKSLANKLYLKKKLFTFHMNSGKKLSKHTDEFNKLIGDLANIDTLLNGRESLTLKDVLSSLNSRELKKMTDAKDDGDGLYVRGRSDHGEQEEINWLCQEEYGTGFWKNTGQGSGMHFKGYDNGDLLMAVSDERFLEWIMNSGGSFHMMPRRDFLFDFKEFNGGTVLLGDNRACAIRETGKVRVQIKDGSSFVLENVRYIPKLKRILIYLGTLDREGYTVKLHNRRIKVIKGSLMVLSGTMKGNYMYSLDGWAESGEANVGIQEKESLAQVWHKRLGHISETGLHELERRDVLGNKGLGKLEFCENCALEKSTRVSFGRDLDTFSSVRRPKNSRVIWKKKKGSSNTSNVGLFAVSVSNLNKNVKRYSRKDLLACNNSHLGETRSVFVCNDAMNVSCDSRMNDLIDDNNFFIFDDVNVRISPVSKMPFMKKPNDSMYVRSKSNMIKSLPRTVHKWLPKLQPLAEPVA
nr:retrovirus-related Pol polyprotein from transposon TNT 1-94 [Tanacetum cinerariifolium]